VHLNLYDGTDRSFDAPIKARKDFLNTKPASTKERLKAVTILLHSLRNSRSRIPAEQPKKHLYKTYKKQIIWPENTD